MTYDISNLFATPPDDWPESIQRTACSIIDAVKDGTVLVIEPGMEFDDIDTGNQRAIALELLRRTRVIHVRDLPDGTRHVRHWRNVEELGGVW